MIEISTNRLEKTEMKIRLPSTKLDSVTLSLKGLLMSASFANKVALLLVFIILLMLVNFGWQLWASFQPRDVIVVSQSSNLNQPTLNLRKLKSYHLFGSPNSNQATEDNSQLEAPITRLKLKLRGVYSASDEALAGAMIEAQNKQQVYRIGDSLPGARGLKLHQIMSDRVIMSRNGKFETLLIEDFVGKGARSTNPLNISRPVVRNKSRYSTSPRSTVDKRNDRNLTKELLKLRSKLSDPQSLNELVSITPAMQNGEFQGFRLAPGKNRALFARMGLRRNDLLKSVNGINLDNPAGAFSLMEQISSADEINLEVKRGARNINIIFSAQAQ